MVLSAITEISELELIGVTTVYGDVDLRAKIALSYLKNQYPVYLGTSKPLSGEAVWHSGQEGTLIDGLSEFKGKDGGVQLLVDEVLNSPDQIEILAIGPLTNIATALKQKHSWDEQVKALWMMGGDFSRAFAEHNLKCDIAAAKSVFDSDLEIYVMPLNVTRQVEIEMEAFGFLGESALGKEIRQWAKYKNLTVNHPHDLLTLIMMIEPGLFTFSSLGRISLTESGIASFTEDKSGRHRIVTGLQVEGARSRVLELLARANR